MKQHKESIRLIGLCLEKYTTNVAGQSGFDCGMLWQRFEEEGIAGRISSKASNTLYAVYYGYTCRDADTQFNYFIGCQVQPDAPIPEGLSELLIPVQSYEVITAHGKMTQCITDAWIKIWQTPHDRAFGYDFEVYDERSQNWEDAAVDIYLSVN